MSNDLNAYISIGQHLFVENIRDSNFICINCHMSVDACGMSFECIISQSKSRISWDCNVNEDHNLKIGNQKLLTSDEVVSHDDLFNKYRRLGIIRTIGNNKNMDKKLGKPVEYRIKHNVIKQAIILKIHDNWSADLYLIPSPHEAINVAIDSGNKIAHVVGGSKKNEIYGVEYCEDRIPGTWGEKL